MLLLLLLKWLLLLLLLLMLWALLWAPRAAATRQHHCFWQTRPLPLLQESGLLLQQRHHVAVPRRKSYLQGCNLQVGSCPAAAQQCRWHVVAVRPSWVAPVAASNIQHVSNEVLLSHVPHIRHTVTAGACG
jgi:hypothetical protein